LTFSLLKKVNNKIISVMKKYLLSLVFVSMTTIGLFSQTHFSKVWTGNGVDHMNFYVLSAELDGVNMEAGDEIAVFDGEYCVGFGTLIQELTGGAYMTFVASKNDATPPGINGFTVGHNISYRIWDSSEAKEITKVEVTYVSGDGVFSIGGTVSFHLSASSMVDQVITLSGGWNIISFFHLPPGTDLMSIFQPLIDNGTLLKVQDETGAALEYVEPIGWVNNIPEFNPTEGYKVKVAGATELITEGFEIQGPFEIPLLEGWNIISYPLSTPQNALDALDTLITEGSLLKVQDETGGAIENVFPIGWVDNIGTFEPGEGYKIKVSENTSITFSESSLKSSMGIISGNDSKSGHFTTVWTGNGFDHMNFYFTSATISDSNMQAPDEIAVFDGDYCVGAGILTQELTGGAYLTFVASKNDATPPEVNGYTSGNVVEFRLWDESEQKEIAMVEATYLDGVGVYSVGGTASLELNGILNLRPVAHSGSDQVVNEGDLVTLDGSGSHDPEDSILTYVWTSPPGIDLSDSTLSDPTFSAPEVTENTSYIFTLVVDDGDLDSDEDSVTITVVNVNKIPVITGQAVLSTDEETALTITLEDLVVADVDNTYPDDFTLFAGDSVNYTLEGNTITPALDFSGDLAVPVRVDDGTDTSHVFNVTVTVNNINDVPVFTSTPDTSAIVDSLYTYNIFATDADTEDLIAIGSITIPSWLTLTDNGDGSAVISGTPAKENLGNNEVVLSLSDGIIEIPVEQSFIIVVEPGTGMAGTTAGSNIKLYPNPTTGEIYLKIGNGEVENLTVHVLNVSGQVIYANKFEHLKVTSRQEIDLTNQPEGIYVVKVYNGNFLKVEMIVIQ
jgi:hypothetical protein